MSEPKKYTLGEKEVQLAPPTPRKFSAFLAAAGVDSLDGIKTEEQRQALGLQILQIQLKPEKLTEMLNVCLVDASGIEWLDADSRIIMEIVTDFFSQYK